MTDEKDSIAYKVCTKCKQERLLSCFSFNKNSKDGHRADCKICVAEYYQKNAERIKKKSLEYRKNNLDKVKENNKSYRQENPEKIKIYQAEYIKKNSEKIKQYRLDYYKNNSEKIISRAVEWAKKNPEKKNKTNKVWSKANPEKVKLTSARNHAKNAATINARKSIWKKNNPELVRIYSQNRRATQKNAGGKLSSDLPKKLLVLQNGKCPCCGKKLGSDYHLDHIVPLFLGGPNTDENMQLLHAKCNLKKAAKDPIEFQQSLGKLI